MSKKRDEDKKEFTREVYIYKTIYSTTTTMLSIQWVLDFD